MTFGDATGLPHQDLPHPLSDELAELIAGRFRVMAEPTRVKILDRLRAGEATVGELAADLGTSQQNVSKHLAVLAQAGIVSREKRGTAVLCAIADESVFQLCEQVCGRLGEQLADVQAILEGREVPS